MLNLQDRYLLNTIIIFINDKNKNSGKWTNRINLFNFK